MAIRQAYSPVEIAQMLGMDKITIYRHIKNGEIPAVKIGGVLRVRASVMREILDGERVIAPDRRYRKSVE